MKFLRKIILGLLLCGAIPTLASTIIKVDGNVVTSKESVYIANGTTMVPLRVIAESMNAKVNYDKNSKTVTVQKNDILISLVIDTYQAKVNDKVTVLNVAPQVKNGITMVPLRFISECLGCSVNYDKANNLVAIIQSKDEVTASDILGNLAQVKTDAYGRAIRTTNLPNNANRFPYIAADVPNWAYEQQPWDDNYWGPYYRSDKLEGASKVSQFPNQVYAEGSTLASVIKDNYETIDNFIKAQICVDYRTIDKETYSSAIANGLALNTTTFKTFEDMKKQAASYVDYVKEKKVIIESEYKILPETAWVSIGDQVGVINFSVYAKVTPKDKSGKSFNTWGGMSVYNTGFNLSDVQKGYTYEGILTYTLIRQQDGTWKLNNNTTDVFTQLAPSCDILNGVVPAQKKLTNRVSKFNYTWTRDKSTYYTRYAKDVKAGF